MKGKIIRIIKILISILFMCFLFGKMDYSEFQSMIDEITFYIVIIAAVIYLISVILNAVKWHVLLPNTNLYFLISLCFRSQLYATVLPGQLFGEASKITHWKGEGQDRMRVAASVAFDKITGIIGQLFLAIIGFSFSDIGKTVNCSKAFAAIGIIFVVLIWISSEAHVSNIIKKIVIYLKAMNKKLGDKCENLYNAWRLFSIDRVVLAKSILWGMLNQFVGIVMVRYVSINMGIRIGIIDFCWIMSVLSLVLLIPISFAGIGLRDASLTSMLSLYGVSSGKSVIISSILLFSQLVASAIGGIMIIFSNIRKNEV